MDTNALLTSIASAATAGRIQKSSLENLRLWLTQPPYASFVPEIAAHVEKGQWAELDEAFWMVIPFGTGGRRGRMYPIGCNVINDRTIGESAQGLADYVLAATRKSQLTCAIAYDTRHRSEHFARLCAEVLVASGFRVYFLQGHRSTPELSFAVRFKQADCGIMVTASHNPPSDNAVKVYWSTGGQLVPPHDEGVIKRVYAVKEIRRAPFDQAVADRRIEFCQDEIDPAYVNAAAAQSLGSLRDVNIIYSPLHGVGATAVLPVLKAAGFDQVNIYTPHSEPSGDFPNVPGHVSNPENPAVFDAIIESAKTTGADLILATDPDCDRLGCAAPLTTKQGSDWATLTGNQIGALLADYILDRLKSVRKLTSLHYLVKTLVTTELIRRIGDSYGVQTHGDLHVGFKWIGEEIDRRGPEHFVFGAEESHGYLVGTYARDKDGAVAALLLSELAAALKAKNQTIHEKLDALFWQFGCHVEQTVSVTMPGAEGMKLMQAAMDRLRQSPPTSLAGAGVSAVRDYKSGWSCRPGTAVTAEKLAAPPGDMVILDLEATGNYVAVRPSGTEPKIKFYMFAYEPAEQLANLEDAKAELRARLYAIATDLKAFCLPG